MPRQEREAGTKAEARGMPAHWLAPQQLPLLYWRWDQSLWTEGPSMSIKNWATDVPVLQLRILFPWLGQLENQNSTVQPWLSWRACLLFTHAVHRTAVSVHLTFHDKRPQTRSFISNTFSFYSLEGGNPKIKTPVWRLAKDCFLVHRWLSSLESSCDWSSRGACWDFLFAFVFVVWGLSPRLCTW